MLYKIVIREPVNNRVVQIHEVYRGNVADYVADELDTQRREGITRTITITALK